MIIQDIAQRLAQSIGLDPAHWALWIGLALRLAIIGAVYLGAISVIAMFSTWWERKVAGHIQGRLGPMHVGLWHGWAQPIADGVKLLLKEDLVPAGADGLLFRLAPYLAFAPVFAAFLALPFGPQFIFEGSLNIGVLYILAVLSVEVMGVILAGWSSNSKWSVYGAMREACQMVSYEIPLGLSIICGVLVAGTLDLTELGYLQGGGLHKWFIFHNPFIFAAFLLYFIASLAENKRAPFDLPESESELVAGFHTEYSGLRWSFFFMAEYGAMFVVGGIQTALFLGAWNSPLGKFDFVYWLLGYSPVGAGQAFFAGDVSHAHGWSQTAAAMGLTPVKLALLNCYSAAWFAAKIMTMIFVQIWLRWTLPRIRIDQVLHACVKVLLPLSLAMLLGTAVWIALVPQAAPVANPVAHPEANPGAGALNCRLGHLINSTPTVEAISQWAMMAAGLAVVAACAAVVGVAFLRRNTNPQQTMFSDVMPVGREVHFTRKPL